MTPDLAAEIRADLATIAATLALVSEAVARLERDYQTLDRELRLTDTLNAMKKRLDGKSGS